MYMAVRFQSDSSSTNTNFFFNTYIDYALEHIIGCAFLVCVQFLKRGHSIQKVARALYLKF